MLKTKREQAICDKYSALDQNKRVHCNQCPLNLSDKLNGEIGCKATHHYDKKLKDWVPDDWQEGDEE